MKKNKKILLGAISAMALAAISTGAVSTLAWYQAQDATAKASEITDLSGTTSAADPEYSASTFYLPLKAGIVRKELYSGRGEDHNLHLAHYYTVAQMTAETRKDSNGDVWSSTSGSGKVVATNSLYTAYYRSSNNDSIVYEKLSAPDSVGEAGDLDPYAYYELQVWVEFPAWDDDGVEDNASAIAYGSSGYYYVSVNENKVVYFKDTLGVSRTQSEVITALASTNVKITLDRDTGSRAKFFDIDLGTTPAAPTMEDGDADPAQTAAKSLSGLSDKDHKKTIASFGLYIEGDTGNPSDRDDDDPSAPDGNFVARVDAA